MLKVIHQIKCPVVGTDGMWVLPKTERGQEKPPLQRRYLNLLPKSKPKEALEGTVLGERKQVTPLMWEPSEGLRRIEIHQIKEGWAGAAG